MRRYLLGVVLAALGGNAGAAWERVGVADDGMVVYADRSTIQKSGDGVKMQALLDYKVAEKDDSGKLFLSVKLLHEYDCKGERGRTLYYSLHAGQMGAGQLVYSEMRTSSEWRPAGRAIIGETLWNFACKKK